MQTIRHLALGACVLCAAAGMVRIFWPENSYKPIINAVLLLYIVSSVIRVGQKADWAAFAAAWREFQTGSTVTEDFSAYRQAVAQAASARALEDLLADQGIAATVTLQDDECLVTLEQASDAAAARQILAQNSGSLTCTVTVEGGERG